MVLTGITIKNFKNTNDPIHIDFKPITLLFGPNSAGKSTIIQALHYAYEIFERANINADTTILGGDTLNLGGFKRLIYNHDLSLPMSLSFNLNLTDIDISDWCDFNYNKQNKEISVNSVFNSSTALKVKYCDDTDSYNTNTFARSSHIYENTSTSLPVKKKEIKENIILNADKIKNAILKIKIQWDLQLEIPIVKEYEIHINGTKILQIYLSSDKKITSCDIFYHDIFSGIDSFIQEIFNESKEKADIEQEKIREKEIDESNKQEKIIKQEKIFSEQLKSLDSQHANEIDVNHKAKLQKDAIKILHNKNEFLNKHKQTKNEKWDLDETEAFNEYKKENISYGKTIITTVEINQKSALPNWDQAILFKLDIDNSINDKNLNTLLDTIGGVIIAPGNILRSCLRKFSYIGPLREIPPRNYSPRLSPNKSRWSSGIAAWDILYNKDKTFLETLNYWIGKERLDTGYKIEIKKIIEINPDINISDELIKKLPIKKKLILRELTSNIEVYPQDIGVGISQVLPIVVGILNAEDGIFAMEQPELHIHPALQVALGDIFISQVNNNTKDVCFVIETHSEHLLLRFLRRIRETTDNELPSDIDSFTPEQLAVYFIDNDSNIMPITKIGIDKDGDFQTNWPKGFFIERGEELF